MITKRFGWIPQKPDYRDLILAPQEIVLPKAVASMTTTISAWDQGDLGSCTSHGIGRIWAHRILNELKMTLMPSRLFLYYQERVLEGTVPQDAGAEIRDGLKVLAKQGTPEEAYWPYVISKFAKKPPKSAYADALKNVALKYHAVLATVDAIKQALAAGFPLAGGFTVFESFMSKKVEKTGVMPMPKKSEAVQGSHCVCWDGYDDAKQVFFCCNSWGVDWGKNGWFSMPYANILNCSDFWTLDTVK